MGAERFLHYRVGKPLGQGGMGEVFLADDERLGRRVALKFLPRAAATDPEAQERLRREARSLAALSHPNIAAVYALESDGERSCLVMEYVEGETLAARIAKRPLPVPEVMATAAAIAEALAHAHAKGVIHRDVKPANILVTPEGVAKLTDFGIAHLEGATRLTAEGFTSGTVAYMSPEQARGASVDGRSDIFSLGAVLYEALTGTRAFATDRPEATLYAVQHHEPEPPSALRSGIPLELERVVLKCLKKDPGLRYQHAEDLAADLKALRGSPTGATASASGATADAQTATVLAGGQRVGAPGGTTRQSGLVPRVALIAALLTVAALVYFLGPFRPGTSPVVNTAEAAQKSIAVLSFENLAEPGDPRGVARISTSLLTVGLGESQVMPVLSAQRIHDVLRQMGKPNQIVKGAEALHVAGRAGAAYVVTGYIYATQPDIVLAAEVASTSDGTVLTACKVQTPGGEQGLYAAVDSLTTSLRDGLARAGFGVRQTPIDVGSLTTRSPAAYRAYIRGLELLYRSKWRDAALAFQSSIAADSTFALAWYHAAVATWWNFDLWGAQAEVETALRLGDRLSGRDRDGLKALGALVAGDYGGSAQQYRELLVQYRDDKEFLYGLGEALYHGNSDELGALQQFEKAIAIDSSFGVAYLHLVDIQIGRRDYTAALASAERLARADPSNSAPLLTKGDVLFLMADVKGGIAACREALARDPESMEAMSKIGSTQAMLGHFDSTGIAIVAISHMNRPDAQFGSRFDQVLLRIVQGRFRESDSLAARLEREQDKHERTVLDPLLRWVRAGVLIELGRTEEALLEIDRFGSEIGQIIHTRTVGLSRTMQLLITAGRLDEAEARLRDRKRLLGKDANWNERRHLSFAGGLVSVARGRAREAITTFETISPDGPPPYREWRRRWALARALLAAGDKDRGLAELEDVVMLVPGCGDPIDSYKAMILLARLYEEAGRRDDALALYKRVAWQYRMAEPGVKANEEALAGIQRLSKTLLN